MGAKFNSYIYSSLDLFPLHLWIFLFVLNHCAFCFVFYKNHDSVYSLNFKTHALTLLDFMNWNFFCSATFYIGLENHVKTPRRSHVTLSHGKWQIYRQEDNWHRYCLYTFKVLVFNRSINTYIPFLNFELKIDSSYCRFWNGANKRIINSARLMCKDSEYERKWEFAVVFIPLYLICTCTKIFLFYI